MSVDIEERLAHHELFGGLTDLQIGAIAAVGRASRAAEGEFLFRIGEPADRFHLITEGHVVLEIVVPGRGPIVLESIGPGEVAGVSWLFPPHRFNLDALAATDVASLEFDAEALRAVLDADCDLGHVLVQRFAHLAIGRLHSARLRLVDLYGDGTS